MLTSPGDGIAPPARGIGAPRGNKIFSNLKLGLHMADTLLPHPVPGSHAITDETQIANFETRPDEFEVLIDGRRIGLTVREFQLFSALAERPNRVMQRPEIYEIVWGNEMRHRDRSVDVVVRKIRRKLERFAPDWRYIHTHFGVGYRFHPERLEEDENVPEDLPAPAKAPATSAPRMLGALGAAGPR